jgi:2-amino-4-hydroxy-6-hydroxymethyldihydropteridine diphosphokinase/dihydropteroate synthase
MLAVFGLGSNCGDRVEFLRKAILKLKNSFPSARLQILAISPIYESDALLPPGAPESWNRAFLNLNILCQTDLNPDHLLQTIKNIEKSLGRQNRARWAPREIDIDILAWDTQVFENERLKIPHPSLMDRPFALLPFADLYPHWVHPLTEHAQPLSQMVSPWRRLPREQVPFRTHRSQHFLTELVGILNITPDSFSDGGSLMDPQIALQRAQEFVAQGIRVLDIGAESTRPGAAVVNPEEEWSRLEPVLKLLKMQQPQWPYSIKLSVDTRNASVAKKAIQLGVDWINDVTGFEDRDMKTVILESQVELVIMHSLTVPPSRNAILPFDEDPASFLLHWGLKKIQELETIGISRNRIILDPGIGFGKSPEQTWELTRSIHRLHELGVRILVGHSRKSFFTSLSQTMASERDLETSLLSTHFAERGVHYLRVHNADLNTRALKTWTQTQGTTYFQPNPIA